MLAYEFGFYHVCVLAGFLSRSQVDGDTVSFHTIHSFLLGKMEIQQSYQVLILYHIDHGIVITR
jgi:hypothetical protein